MAPTKQRFEGRIKENALPPGITCERKPGQGLGAGMTILACFGSDSSASILILSFSLLVRGRGTGSYKRQALPICISYTG